MIAKTTVYPNADVKATFTVFGRSVEIGGVYSVTKLDNGYFYISSIYYPYHYEMAETELSITYLTTPESQIYVTEVE